MNHKEWIDCLRLQLSKVEGSTALNDALLRALLARNSLFIEHYFSIISIRRSMGILASILAPSQKDSLILSSIRCIPESGIEEFLSTCTVADGKVPGGKVLTGIILLENIGSISTHLAVFLETLLRHGHASHNGVSVRVPDLFLMVAEQDRSDRDAVARLHATIARCFSMKLCLDMPNEDLEFLQLSQPDVQMDVPSEDINFMIAVDLRQGLMRDVEMPEELVRRAIQLANRIQEDDRVMTGGRPGQSAMSDWLRAARVEAFLRDARVVEWNDFHETAQAILCHRVRLHTRTLEKSGKIIDAALEANRRSAVSKKSIDWSKDTNNNDCSNHSLLILHDEVFKPMSEWLNKKILGRNNDDSEYGVSTLDLVLLTLFSGGHILLEDFPGSGKSYLAQTLGHMIEDDREEEPIDILSYNRIQCTPDLLPSDITGYMILENGQMRFRRGPIFSYILLLDEINRTTPKVQSSMLQAMAERQISIDDRTYDLSSLFFVIATQNPLDRVGTYELPYAQLDRFLFKRELPPITDQLVIKKIMQSDFGTSEVAPRIPATRIMAAIRAIDGKSQDGKEMIHVPDRVYQFILNISAAIATRCEPKYGSVERQNPDHRLKPGSQPSVRTLQRLIPALKTLAWINASGRDCQVTIEHVKLLCCDWLRHRILPVNANAGGGVDEIIKCVLEDAIEQDSGSGKVWNQ